MTDQPNPKSRSLANRVMPTHRARKLLTICAMGATLLTAWTAPAAFAQSVPAELTYDSVIRLARDNNFAIRQAQSRIEEAQGRTMSTRSNTLPSLDLLGQYQRVDSALMEGGGDDEAWNVDLQLSQRIYAGGGIRARVNQAESLLSAAEAEFISVVQTALLDVQVAWLTALLARESVNVRAESVRLLEQQLANVRSRYEAGSVSRFELLRAEVALANGRPPLIRAQNAYTASVIQLLSTIGLSSVDPEGIRLSGAMSYSEETFNLLNMLGIARNQRVEYQLVEAQLAAAQSGLRAVKAANRPTLDLVAAYGIRKSALSSAWDNTVDGWRVGLQGAWNIWDANGSNGDRRTALAQVRQVELARDELDIQISAQVRTALLAVEEARQLVEASRRVVEQAQEALRLAEDRYNVGTAIQLEVLESQVALTEARTNELQALFDFNIAHARLQRAIGAIR